MLPRPGELRSMTTPLVAGFIQRMFVRLLRATLLIACLLPSAAHARGPVTDDITFNALPREAQHTLQLIRNGGPFPYPRDGVVFGNRERILPMKARGYYREYTVTTPGSRNRGAQRIVCGGDQRSARECWYSNDHYQSFRRIR